MPEQMTDGMACFMDRDPRLGDHCGPWPVTASASGGSTGGADLLSALSLDSAFGAMLGYCLVNFGYNVLSLLVTKHGSAVLMVVSAALALPLTNLAFASTLVMGDDAEVLSRLVGREGGS